MDTQLLITVLFLFMTYICPFIFTFMAYSPPYFSVNWHIKMASKVSQYIMAYRKIPFCLWHIDVGLHTFILYILCHD